MNRPLLIAAAATLALTAAREADCGRKLLRKVSSWDFFTGAKGQIYGDESAGFKGTWEMKKDRGVFEFGGGGSWGCGVAISREDAPVNLAGAKKITLTLKVSKGCRFYFYLNEDGVGPPNAGSFKGDDGADGEQYYHDLIAGDGTEREYPLPLEDLALAEIWGNQNGDKKLALQAINEIGFYVPPDVRDGRIEIVSVKFE